MTALFVCYERTPSGHGRITSSSTVIEHESFAAQLTAADQTFIMVPLDGWTGYVTLDQNGSPEDMHLREAFRGAPDKTEVEMLEITTIPNVPACQVRISGPMTNREVVHQGGDLQMRFALPGTYVVAFEAFPLLPYEASLVVRQPETVTPEVI